MKKTTTSKTVEVGQVRAIPWPGQGQAVYVHCVVLDTRQAYGRSDIKVAPVEGSGALWVTEATVVA